MQFFFFFFLGGGGGGSNKGCVGDVQVAYIRYVVQGMMHPSFSIVENDNAVRYLFCYYVHALFFSFEI